MRSDFQCPKCGRRWGMITDQSTIVKCPGCQSELDLTSDKEIIKEFKQFLKTRKSETTKYVIVVKGPDGKDTIIAVSPENPIFDRIHQAQAFADQNNIHNFRICEYRKDDHGNTFIGVGVISVSTYTTWMEEYLKKQFSISEIKALGISERLAYQAGIRDGFLNAINLLKKYGHIKE